MPDTQSSKSTDKTALNPKLVLFILYSLYDPPSFM